MERIEKIKDAFGEERRFPPAQRPRHPTSITKARRRFCPRVRVPSSRRIRRKSPGRWTSVTLVMIKCHMKPEYTHPATARHSSLERGYAGPAATVGTPSPAPIFSPFVGKTRSEKASRSRMQVATYESRIRLGNGSRTAASRIPRVCASATRRKRRRSP